MRKILLLLLGIFGLMTQSAMAQDRQVTGKVTSAEDGQPLPGVSVVVKGTTRGTQTDATGNYVITLPKNARSLVFSFVGTDTKEISLGNQSAIDVVMTNDSRSLDEVVVVGYGSESKRNLTGNIASVSGKDIENVPVPSVEQALQGRVAGVQISSLNGKLGQGLQIRVRGSSSVTASNQPLYVIDGIPVTSQDQSTDTSPTNPIADLNFNDIESVQILKDASASAIYGSRASNGVVLITTKKGRAGKTQFELSGFGGVSDPTNKREFLNTQEYVSYIQGALANSEALGLAPFGQEDLAGIFTQLTGGDRAAWENATVNTNWQDQVLRSAPIQQYDLSARGGDAKTRFFVSGGYSDQQGILVKNRFQRLSGRVNLDHTATDKLTIGVNLNVARTTNDRLSNDNAFSTPMQIVALPFFTPLTDPTTGQLSNDFTLYYNPLLNRDFSSNTTTVNRLFGNAYADYKIIPGLSFRTEAGVDLLIQRENQYFGRETARNNSAPNGLGFDSWTQISNYTTNNFLTFGQTFAQKHDVDATVGASYQESNRVFNSVTAQQYPSNAYKQISSAANVTGGNGNATNFSFLSYFARVNYRYNNRYILGLSGRVDGSSRFGADNRYGFFPAASVGWIVTEESFMKNIPVLSLLKLRASYGITGNAEIGDFSSRGLFTGTAGYAGVPGQAPIQIENPGLKWEKTTQTDVGLEFGLLSDRISGEVDYYIKETTDLLLNVNVPGSSGYSTQLRNVGIMENKGFEFVLNTRNTVGAFKWETSLNIANNANKVLDLNDQVINGGYINRAVEGQPIGVFFSREYAGVDPANGDALYYKNTTNTDGSIDRTTVNADNVNQAQLVVLGNPNPTYIGGVTNTFSYKGIDLSVLFQGQFGNKIYNGAGGFMSANGDFFDNQTRDQLNSWKNPGDITDVPQARLYGGNGTAASSRYLQNGDFVRLKSVTLGYNLPKPVLSKLNLTKVRFYVSGVNLLTFTKYTGWDPEVNTDYLAGNIGLGNDFYSAPQARTITGGINIGF
ncbi:MAG: TonB-dependent receptor [Bacteroidetes bacterium]|nr:TonB-dependent receptor [Fibrella sp.]